MDNKELFESLESLAASWKDDDKPMLLHEEVIYGFEMKNIDQLATSLSSLLKVHLYPKFSPMEGKWYSSYEITRREQRLQDDRQRSIKETSDIPNAAYTLRANDPEPGYTAPEFPGGGYYLLKVTSSPSVLSDIDKTLSASGLQFKELKRVRRTI